MRLIDANELLATFGKIIREPRYQHDGEDYYVGIADASGAVVEQAIIDAVPVVRCKDCKHYEIHKPKVLENCERNGYLIRMKPDDFCSYGERKDNE